MAELGDFGEYSGDEDDVADDGAVDGDRSESETPDERDAPGDRTAADFDRRAVETVGVDTGLGAITVAEGLRLAERAEDTRLRAYVTRGARERLRIGTYVIAPYPDRELLFCRVAALEYAQQFHADDATEIHARRAMRRDGVDEADYKLLAGLEPVAVLYPEAGELRRRMADRLPKPGAVVREATDREEIKTGLKIPEEGVFVGHLAVGGEVVRTAAEPPTIDYRLADSHEVGDPLVFRHTLVAGGTGSGKTHVAKNVLRQFLAADRTYPMADGRSVRPAVVQFDPQDEYAQMHDDNDALDAERSRRFEREGIAHGGLEDTIAMVPTVGDATYTADHHGAEQLAFTLPFSMVRSNPWLVAGSGLNDNQYAAIRYLIRRFFENHGSSGGYTEFIDFLDDPGLREELDETGRVHEATYDAVRRRVRGFQHVFDRDARPITELVHRLVRPGGLTTIPTYHLSDSRAAETVVLGVASLLIEEKLSNDPVFERIAETPLIVGMDEAHNFLADPNSVQGEKVIGRFTEAAKQGRKERLGLFLVTQDPQDVADPVFKQINTRIVLNLGDEDAISSVNVPTELEARVPYLERGEMVVYSPDNSEPVELAGLDVCVTRHGRDQ